MITLQRENTPLFYRDRMPQIIETLETMDLPFDREAARKQVRHPQLDPPMLDILVDVICTTTLFDDFTVAKRIDLYLFQEFLISICYRLVAIPYLHSPSKIEDAYHIGLTLYMMTLFLQVGSQRIMNYDNVTRRLRKVLESDVLDSEDDLRFWLMVVGGVWVLDDEDADWLMLMVNTQAEKMQIRSWAEARDVLNRGLWLGVVHDGPGSTVWTRARCE